MKTKLKYGMIGGVTAVSFAAALLFINLKTKGGVIMMAMFFAQRVILDKTKFEAVPKTLKAAVAEALLDSGLPELVPAEYGGTAT